MKEYIYYLYASHATGSDAVLVVDRVALEVAAVVVALSLLLPLPLLPLPLP